MVIVDACLSCLVIGIIVSWKGLSIGYFILWSAQWQCNPMQFNHGQGGFWEHLGGGWNDSRVTRKSFCHSRLSECRTMLDLSEFWLWLRVLLHGVKELGIKILLYFEAKRNTMFGFHSQYEYGLEQQWKIMQEELETSVDSHLLFLSATSLTRSNRERRLHCNMALKRFHEAPLFNCLKWLLVRL